MSASKLRDVRKLADSRAVFELDFPLRDLPGFPAEYLAGAGQVHARMSFGREQGYAMAQVALQTELTATCQRCLGTMRLRIDTDSPVLLVESAQEAEGAPAGWETFLAPEGRLVLEALTAEELLLALPIVPLHEDEAQCEPLAREVTIERADIPQGRPQTAESGGVEGVTSPSAAADAAVTRAGVTRVGRGPRDGPAAQPAMARPFADLRALLERGGKRE